MKLSTLDSTTKANDGVWIDIGDPRTGAKTGLQVRVLGADAKAYKAAEKELRADIVRGKEYDDPEAELALRTSLDWRGAEGDDGKEVAFSRDELRSAFEKYPTIRDQIVLKQKNRALFMEAASEN